MWRGLFPGREFQPAQGSVIAVQDVHGPTVEPFGSPIQRDLVFVGFPAGKGVVPAPVDGFPAARIGVAIEVESHLIAPVANPVKGRGVQQAVARTQIGQRAEAVPAANPLLRKTCVDMISNARARADGSRTRSDHMRITGFSG